jgi:uncharacterized protein (TIGR02453 family)
VRFTGFPDEALVFYERLEADNSREYWTAAKPVYDAAVRAPMDALLAELAPEFGEAKVFRPHRDVRFSKDKSPFKTHIGAVVGGTGSSLHYVQLSADGLMAAGGLYGPAADQLARQRAAIADDRLGGELERLLAPLRVAGFEIGADPLATAPRGYSREHPRIELLRQRHLVAVRRWPPAAWLHRRGALTRVVEALRATRPLNAWLEDHVGVTRLPPTPRR